VNADHIIARNVGKHAQDGCINENAVRYEHERSIRDLVAELNTLRGVGQNAANGCVIFTMPLEDAEVMVEFEIEPASGDGWDEPRYERSISATAAFIGGVWVPASIFQLHITEQWEALATDMIDDEAEAAAESAAEARAEDLRLRLAE